MTSRQDKLYIFCMIVGVFILTGTEGGCKQDTLSFGDVLLLTVLGLLLMGLPLVLSWLEERKDQERANDKEEDDQ